MFVTNSFLFHKTLRLAAGGGAYALTGRAVDIRRLNALSGVRRTYAVAGQSAALRKASKIGLVTGTYAVAGPAVQMKRQLRLSANAASLAITGQSAGLQKSRVSGFVKTEAYIEEQDVGLFRHLKLNAAAASSNVAAGNVGLLKVAGTVEVYPAEWAAAGQDIAMRASRILGGDTAALAIDTRPAGVKRGYPLVAGVGAAAISGKSVALRTAKRIVAVKSGFAIAAPSLLLKRSPRATFNAGYSSSADSATYSFSTSGIAAGDKLVVVSCHWNSTVTLRSVTSRTVDGQAASSAIAGSAAVSGQGGSSVGVDLFYFRTSVANPTVAWSLDAAGSVRAYSGVWIIEGELNSDAPFDFDKTTVAGGTSISRTIDLDVGGVGLMALTIDNAVAPTPAGLDVTDWNLTHAEGGTRIAGGRYRSTAGQTGRSISATYAAGGGEAIAVASWR